MSRLNRLLIRPRYITFFCISIFDHDKTNILNERKKVHIQVYLRPDCITIGLSKLRLKLNYHSVNKLLMSQLTFLKEKLVFLTEVSDITNNFYLTILGYLTLILF